MPNIKVTYMANANPSIQVSPFNQRVHPGSRILTWKPTNCTFPRTGGIVFAPTDTAPAIWPYQQPVRQSNGNYKTTDDNRLRAGETAITYNYNITIISNGGSTHRRMDPDVTNTPE
jgi:hypothetical protein